MSCRVPGRLSGRYTSKDAPVRALWLESYDGGPRSIDRMIRGNVYAPRWSVVVSGTIHPGQLVGMAQYGSAIGCSWHGRTAERLRRRRTCSRRFDRASRPPVLRRRQEGFPTSLMPADGRHFQGLAMGFGGALLDVVPDAPSPGETTRPRSAGEPLAPAWLPIHVLATGQVCLRSTRSGRGGASRLFRPTRRIVECPSLRSGLASSAQPFKLPMVAAQGRPERRSAQRTRVLPPAGSTPCLAAARMFLPRGTGPRSALCGTTRALYIRLLVITQAGEERSRHARAGPPGREASGCRSEDGARIRRCIGAGLRQYETCKEWPE
jgi:hypothetical protein